MECTRETDGRKNDSLTQEYIRNQVVKAIKAGRHPRDVAEIFGISERHVYRILAAYFSGGKNALLTKKSTGRPCKLSVDEIQWLEQAIREQTPCQFKFEFALWTLRTVQQLIRDRFDKELSISATRQLLHSLGFTPQKPRLKAWQQDDALVQQWHQQDFPHIQQQAKAVGASFTLRMRPVFVQPIDSVEPVRPQEKPPSCKVRGLVLVSICCPQSVLGVSANS